MNTKTFIEQECKKIDFNRVFHDIVMKKPAKYFDENVKGISNRTLTAMLGIGHNVFWDILRKEQIVFITKRIKNKNIYLPYSKYKNLFEIRMIEIEMNNEKFVIPQLQFTTKLMNKMYRVILLKYFNRLNINKTHLQNKIIQDGVEFAKQYNTNFFKAWFFKIENKQIVFQIKMLKTWYNVSKINI